MAFTHTLTYRVASAGETITKLIESSAGSEQNLSEAIPANQTNLLVVYSLDVSACESFYLFATQNMTIKTNNSGSPDDTIVLRANEPYQWHTNAYDAFLLTADVTALYVTNTTAGDLQIRALMDPTPP